MEMCEFCTSSDGIEPQDMGEGRVMRLCVNCRVNIALNEERAAEMNRERARTRVQELVGKANPAMGLEFKNTARWEPLGHAYAMSLRLTECHLAMAIVEECGASPELTEAVSRLSQRLDLLQSETVKAVNASIGNGWTTETA